MDAHSPDAVATMTGCLSSECNGLSAGEILHQSMADLHIALPLCHVGYYRILHNNRHSLDSVSATYLSPRYSSLSLNVVFQPL